MSLTLVATGGTIASTRGDDGAVTATRSGRDLLDLLPDGDDVEVVELPVPGSWNMSGSHALRIARAARDALLEGASGVVVTHGTDVLEETAYLTELVARSATVRGAIVFTGGMRHGSEFGEDGPRNLLDALSVARSRAAAGRGVLVCFNGEIHHARRVVKTHATALCTFASPTGGPVGTVDEAGVRFRLEPPPPPAEPPVEPALGALVPIVSSHWDSHESLVPWYLEQGAAGLVVEAGGAGNVNAGLLSGLAEALSAGVPVVVASRCRAGEVMPIYGGAGGFATLAAQGAISSVGLTAGKARLAVQVALGDGGSPESVRSYFDALGDTR